MKILITCQPDEKQTILDELEALAEDNKLSAFDVQVDPTKPEPVWSQDKPHAVGAYWYWATHKEYTADQPRVVQVQYDDRAKIFGIDHQSNGHDLIEVSNFSGYWIGPIEIPSSNNFHNQTKK